jgi:FMN phosphatase YigB (HAD superfamily)
MQARQPIVFLFDVDNTLLDNDRVVRDLASHLDRDFGRQRRDRYFAIFEELRGQLGYADYLGALQRYRAEYPTDPRLLQVSSFLVDYPFANRLFPNALDAIEHCKRWGQPVVLSDGDVVFQPRKVERSGIAEAVDGQVLIYIHKEQMLGDVESRYPAEHYVLVDDKVRILTAAKQYWGERLTTVFPRQGHYALDLGTVQSYPAPDVTLDRVGQLAELDLHSLLDVAIAGAVNRKE